MALTKITSTNIGANAVANSIGYTPANKAGDTFTGDVSLSSTTTPNFYINSSNTSVNQNLWFRSNGTDTFGIEAQSNTGGSGAFLSNRSDGGAINIRTTTGGSLQTSVVIDGAGRVTTPYHPCFYAYNNQSNPSIGNSYQAIVLNGTNYNIGGHFNTTNYRFTAPITGTYLFHAKVNVYSNPGVIRAWITLNGSRRFTGAGFTGNVSGDNDTTASLVYRLNVNDYVSLDVYTGNGGNISSGETWNSLSGYLLG